MAATTAKATADKFYGTGRRKTAVARVWISQGTGQMQVNGRDPEDYFHRFVSRASMVRPLIVTDLDEKIDIKARVSGGGHTGQAEALSHGLSRALVAYDEALRPALKKNGLLTRDPREKERKKYGQPGARKRYQFSKR